jgi:nucleotide-binding universal stress UspA family protein
MQGDGVQGSPQLLEVASFGDDFGQQISRTAKASNADLVVMGTHGRRGWRRLVLGSVAERFLRMSKCPLLLVPSLTVKPKASHDLNAPNVAEAWL